MILIVDDHYDVIDWMRTVIQDAGYYCDCASDATLAFYKVQRLDYALAIIDVGLPDYPGTTLAKLIRNLPGASGKMPLVAMSGMDLTEDRDLFERVLLKPIGTIAIHDVIVEHARPHIKDLHVARAIMGGIKPSE